MKIQNKKMVYILTMVLGLGVFALAYFLPILNVEAAGKFSLGKFLTDASVNKTLGYWLVIAYMTVSIIAFLAGLVGMVEIDEKVVKSSRYTGLVNYCAALLAAVLFAAAVFMTYYFFRTNVVFKSNVSFAYGFYIVCVLFFGLIGAITFYFNKEK